MSIRCDVTSVPSFDYRCFHITAELKSSLGILFYFVFLFFLLYNIVLILPHINMNPPRAYMCSLSWTTPHLPPRTIPRSHPSAPAPSILYRTWTGEPFHIWYYRCFSAIPPNHPTLSLSYRTQKTVLYICVSFAVSHTGLSLPSF